MFTGIIEGLGTITKIRSSGQGKRLTIEADYPLDHTKIGDSIAVSGACLTAVMIDGKSFEVDMSPETLSKTTFGKAKIGDRVNLERALCLSDRIDGHLVSGHIDGIGSVKNIKTLGNAIIITFEVPESLSRYMIRKGSVAVDGISLTINNCDHGSFEVSIIPHTAKLTSIGFKKIGDHVNIETDMIGKYVERFMRNDNEEQKARKSSIDKQFLAKSGFL
ncbi:MAG: riboflavin synthase [Proteobacteria bacterium]|nr:riboflavin synthase [Desulfobacteraceae bacterium]MBU3980894.1 riboflavin synthase [Pseudomonadota bacterium]MBU4100000.1 riboflavin synthase [Pseudomonadota bacterium]